MSVETEYLTVTALTQYIKKKFEYDPYLDRVFLTGEISNFRPRPNAHQYFSLKDDRAKISAIMFKSAYGKIKFQPEEGMKVRVVGRIGVYEGSGSYQIYVEQMEPDGIGALYKAYEQLKAKLADQGLFSAPKRQIPVYPKRIAVITSPSGAVIRDIITTVKRRYPIVQLVLFPTLVQGDQAAADITKRINQVNQIGNFDTIIVGRGGGSIEDLWPFNEENVAFAIANSTIPVISSVGHETDTTIADLVADMRAATPTAAAELATPVLNDELLRIRQLATRLEQTFSHQLTLANRQLTQLENSYVFRQPQRLYESFTQNVDQAKQRLIQNMSIQSQNARVRYSLLAQQLNFVSPKQQIKHQSEAISLLKAQLNTAIQSYFDHLDNQTRQLVSALDYLSPLKIMGRGYSYVTDESDKVLNQTDDFKKDQLVWIHVADGQVKTKIEVVEESKHAN